MAQLFSHNVRQRFEDYAELNAQSWKGGPNSVPYSPPLPHAGDSDADDTSFGSVVMQAKRRLAAQLGVAPASIEIRIQS